MRIPEKSFPGNLTERVALKDRVAFGSSERNHRSPLKKEENKFGSGGSEMWTARMKEWKEMDNKLVFSTEKHETMIRWITKVN